MVSPPEIWMLVHKINHRWGLALRIFASKTSDPIQGASKKQKALCNIEYSPSRNVVQHHFTLMLKLTNQAL